MELLESDIQAIAKAIGVPMAPERDPESGEMLTTPTRIWRMLSDKIRNDPETCAELGLSSEEWWHVAFSVPTLYSNIIEVAINSRENGYHDGMHFTADAVDEIWHQWVAQTRAVLTAEITDRVRTEYNANQVDAQLETLARERDEANYNRDMAQNTANQQSIYANREHQRASRWKKGALATMVSTVAGGLFLWFNTGKSPDTTSNDDITSHKPSGSTWTNTVKVGPGAEENDPDFIPRRTHSETLKPIPAIDPTYIDNPAVATAIVSGLNDESLIVKAEYKSKDQLHVSWTIETNKGKAITVSEYDVPGFKEGIFSPSITLEKGTVKNRFDPFTGKYVAETDPAFVAPSGTALSPEKIAKILALQGKHRVGEALTHHKPEWLPEALHCNEAPYNAKNSAKRLGERELTRTILHTPDAVFRKIAEIAHVVDKITENERNDNERYAALAYLHIKTDEYEQSASALSHIASNIKEWLEQQEKAQKSNDTKPDSPFDSVLSALENTQDDISRLQLAMLALLGLDRMEMMPGRGIADALDPTNPNKEEMAVWTISGPAALISILADNISAFKNKENAFKTDAQPEGLQIEEPFDSGIERFFNSKRSLGSIISPIPYNRKQFQPNPHWEGLLIPHESSILHLPGASFP